MNLFQLAEPNACPHFLLQRLRPQISKLLLQLNALERLPDDRDATVLVGTCIADLFDGRLISRTIEAPLSRTVAEQLFDQFSGAAAFCGEISDPQKQVDNDIFELTYQRPEQALYKLYWFTSSYNVCVHSLNTLKLIINQKFVSQQLQSQQLACRCLSCMENDLLQFSGFVKICEHDEVLNQVTGMECNSCGQWVQLATACERCGQRQGRHVCTMCKVAFDFANPLEMKHCNICDQCHFQFAQFCKNCRRCHVGRCGPYDFCAFCGECVDPALQLCVFLDCGHIYHKWCFLGGNAKCCFCKNNTRLK